LPPAAGRPPAIVHIDQGCAFCQRSASFAKRRGADATFTGGAEADTMVLEVDGKRYVRSDAALRLARRMRWPWSWLGALGLLVPRPLRDAVYRWVAKRRRHLHGAG
jgi:predicted DCC family thiol-disulfide oxidoreductase YuxK